jgi:hypothetical protein
VAIRVCPQCLRTVPAGATVAFSDNIVCPHCEAPLRVSDASKIIGGFLGLGVGWLVWGLTRGASGPLGWALPALYSFLAYSVSYTLYLMFTADLVMRPPDVEPAPVAADAHGAGGGHH